jgi:hypothetical protein
LRGRFSFGLSIRGGADFFVNSGSRFFLVTVTAEKQCDRQETTQKFSHGERVKFVTGELFN